MGLDSQHSPRWDGACLCPGVVSREVSSEGGSSMKDIYDLVAVGSGTAAQVASARVHAAGWRVAVIDHRPFGGTCALRGCDPKKMLISGAEAIDAVRRMGGRGIEGEARIDWPALVAFKRS